MRLLPHYLCLFKPVFGIRDILVRNRVMILWSILATNGSGCEGGSECGTGSFSIRHWPSRLQRKIIFFLQVNMLFPFLNVYLHRSSKKKVKKITYGKNQGFSSFFACWWKNPDPYKQTTDPDADLGGPKTCGSYGVRILNTGLKT